MEASKAKRVRRDPETTRKLILDATETLMVEEGYAAVTSRRVAQELGLNSATIHYYYPTTDDLFIALHERMTKRQLSEASEVPIADDPLRAIWEFQSNWSQSALAVEFIGLANHRKNIRKRIATVTNAARRAQAKALEPILKQIGIDTKILPPAALPTIVIAIARTLANEERVGITQGHKEVRMFVDWALANVLQPKRRK